eukprot:6183352-Pleurochrysis_carterae.AAC.3
MRISAVPYARQRTWETVEYVCFPRLLARRWPPLAARGEDGGTTNAASPRVAGSACGGDNEPATLLDYTAWPIRLCADHIACIDVL